MIRSSVERFASSLSTTAAGPLCFEAVSWLGRLFAKRLPLDRMKDNYLNLGSGTVYATGFINVDFFWTRSRKDYGADLRFPLKMDSDSVDGILCEHTMEHLTYQQVKDLLQECCRVLKPQGVIRIVVPDVSLFLTNYVQDSAEWFKQWEELMFINSPVKERATRRLTAPMEAISFITQEYGHRSCWDQRLFAAYLEGAGFEDIQPAGFRAGRCQPLLVDSDDKGRRFVSLYVEATKPMADATGTQRN